MPITQAAYEMTRKSGFYGKDPGAELAVKQLTNKPPTANSKGLRFGNFVQGREVIEEELEAVFAGKKEPKVALDDAVKRGNDVLRKFEAATSEPLSQSTPGWESALSSARRGCRTRCLRRRSRSPWCFSSGRRCRPSGTRSSCRTPSG